MCRQKRDWDSSGGNQTYNGQTSGLSAESVLGDQSFKGKPLTEI